ncbi:MAG: efflux RND transporter permease subunit [Candidatus Saccharibacteria bacterium]|nr:efflux RND transporter permease subunit [Candidatus Saccharibacteria bacterium]
MLKKVRKTPSKTTKQSTKSKSVKSSTEKSQKTAVQSAKNDKLDNWFIKLSSFFFKDIIMSMTLWIAIIITSILVYNNFIGREGFPTVNFPITTINGAYFSDDTEVLDKDIVQPLTAQIQTLESIDSIDSYASNNFFTLVLQFDSETSADIETSKIQNLISSQNNLLPEGVVLNYKIINPGQWLDNYDLILSLHDEETTSIAELEQSAQQLAQKIADSSDNIGLAEPQFLLETAFNPINQQQETRQANLNYLGVVGENGDFAFHQAITIGLTKAESSDLNVIEFSEHIHEILLTVNGDEQTKIYVVGDFAESINQQINSLEDNLTTALIAVMIVSFLLISWRASIVTALFMISVIMAAVLIMYLAGLTLNIVTLFTLILALGLFVDDATIIVEVIEANRRKLKDKFAIITESIRRVGRASFIGTITTILVFAPLLFVSGIIGEFIRIMPVTVIIALMTSFILSLTLIPILSRGIILRRQGLDKITKLNPIAKLETHLAESLAQKIRNLAKPGWKNKIFSKAMIGLSIVMILLSFTYFGQLNQHIFTGGKDGNDLLFSVTLPRGSNLDQAQDIYQVANQSLEESLEGMVNRVVYVSANQNSALAYIDLIPYQDREITSVALAQKAQDEIVKRLDNKDIIVSVSNQGPGAQPDEFPFKVQVVEDDPQLAGRLIEELNQYLLGAEIERPNGQLFEITETQLPDTEVIQRTDGQKIFVISAKFNADDLSTLIQTTTDYVEDKFTEEYLVAQGFSSQSIQFDAGQEEENLEAFFTLVLSIPFIILVMYLLLCIQFKSTLRPFLILLAVPFGLFGVGAGLYYTDHPVSFFSMLGIMALIGIAVNNTILLTDYTRQELEKGKDILEAVASATQARFRPLLTTSLTTVVALLPLALNDPFWQALSLTIIFGLLSSTFLVILAFPYYLIITESIIQKWKDRKKNKVSLTK